MTNSMGRGAYTSLRFFLPFGAACMLVLSTACGSGQTKESGSPDAALPGTGDDAGSGGATGSGGALGQGGAGVGGSTVVVVGSGGVTGTGGSTARGGVTGTGGGIATGGIAASGGAVANGGSGGKSTTGGTIGSGGKGASGGAIGTGGKTATGGAIGTGGKTPTGIDSGPGAGGSQGIDGGQGGSSSGLDGSLQIPPGAPGNPDGHCSIPTEAQLEDVSTPTTVVGTGTPDSCTGDAFIAAVAKGGVITFNCGSDMATVRLSKPAKVFNDKGPKIVIDGGGKVTLSGENVTRILYMNTCDQNQVWTTSHCDNQDSPQLTVQNLTFANANSKNETQYDGGGAIYASGGRFKAINTRFVNNVCADTGPDLGGGAIRVFQQYQGLPAYVVNCTFGGADGLGNVCSNGGALSSIGVSWTVLNTLISYNQAIGNGGNPAQSGTPGGGSGGGIYNDGNTMTLTLCGTRMEYNQVNAYGSAIFFVSNDHTGNIVIDSSTITNNIGGSWYPTYPQISNHDDTPITVTNSTIK